MKNIDSKFIQKVLETPFWIETLEPMEVYQRRHDDTDGKDEGYIGVCIDISGDAYVFQDGQTPWLRFRTFGGGGMSLRTRTALMILAEAIRLDNLKVPREPRT